jgi:Flp pilus assembly protein TadD
MGDLNERDVKRLETEYRRILDALVSSQGSKADVHRAVRKRGLEKAWQAGSPTLESQARDLTAAAVRGWFGKDAKVPTLSSHLDALKDVVSEALPEAAEEFSSVVDALRRVRARNQRNAQGSKAGTSSRTRFEDALLHPPCSILELDLKQLMLGSWVSGGELPQYCRRNVDAQIVDALNDESRTLLVLSGPPKSGKTRTLTECLEQSELRNATVYWLSAASGSIPLVLEKLRSEDGNNSVIVLDDLQRFPFDLRDGLTPQRLEALLQRGKVLVTVHDSQLVRWAQSSTIHEAVDGSMSQPHPEVRSLLLEARLELTPDLTPHELDEARSIFTSQSGELKFLAAWLASSEALKHKARGLLVGSTYEVCAMRAVIDARILNPSGVGIEAILAYAKDEFGEISPNGIWSPTKWEDALEELTRPVTLGAPHSILMRQSRDGTSFSLMDSLWADLKPDTWNFEHLNLPHLARDDIGGLAAEAGVDEALRILREGAEAGDADCMTRLGLELDHRGTLDEAEHWYRKAIGLQNSWAMNNLAILLADRGADEEAEALYRRAIEAGHEQALSNFGFFLGTRSRLAEAEEAFRRSVELADPESMAILAVLLADRGADEEAELLFRWAIEAGSEVAPPYFGGFLEEHGRLAEAEEVYRRSVELADPESMASLASLLADRGADEEAELLFRRAIKAGSERAPHSFGLFLAEHGRLGEAEEAYRQGIELGEAYSVINLAILLAVRGADEEAEALLRRGIETGNDLVANKFGLFLAERGRLGEAEEAYRQGIDLGNADSLFNLAILLADRGADEEAEALYRRAIDEGSKLAPAYFGFFLYQRVRLAEAEEAYRQGVDLGDSYSMNNLANLLADRGADEEAEALYRRAIEVGNEHALSNLGEFLAERGRLPEAEEPHL